MARVIGEIWKGVQMGRANFPPLTYYAAAPACYAMALA